MLFAETVKDSSLYWLYWMELTRMVMEGGQLKASKA